MISPISVASDGFIGDVSPITIASMGFISFATDGEIIVDRRDFEVFYNQVSDLDIIYSLNCDFDVLFNQVGNVEIFAPLSYDVDVLTNNIADIETILKKGL